MANTGTLHPNRRLAVWGGTAALMVIPILPERLSGSAAFDVGDFIFLGILLAGVGAAFELAVRTPPARAYLTAAGIAIAAILLQAWINLAVGIVGSEENSANLIYAGVIAVAVGGAILARFRAAGLARAMVAAAVAQVAAMIALMIAGLGFTGPITIFFTALWLIAASLFRRSTSNMMETGQ